MLKGHLNSPDTYLFLFVFNLIQRIKKMNETFVQMWDSRLEGKWTNHYFSNSIIWIEFQKQNSMTIMNPNSRPSLIVE